MIRTIKSIALLSALSAPLSGCAIFDDPLGDDSSPAVATTAPPTSSPSNSPTTPATPTPSGPPAANEQADSSTPRALHFLIASYDELPAVSNVTAFVHFTNTSATRDTGRELALCKSMLSRFTPTPVAEVPEDADVVVWPVRKSGVGDACLEMLTNYEPVDISERTAARVNEQAIGPFLLTHSAQPLKRQIYDMSNIDRASFSRAVGNWHTLVNNSPDRWPAYRYAR